MATFFEFLDQNLKNIEPKILKFCMDIVNTIMNVSEKYQKFRFIFNRILNGRVNASLRPNIPIS
uniref:Uncharacterized protein n=1 Tax=Meloidogyne enterolobii TaxID=390850 RepID=A0A6V7UKM2_MELEN|nr:unnamed protein product [Meloidogyne enterolobii]